jgi:cysteine desulfurase
MTSPNAASDPIVLDYGATTPVDPAVLEAMLPYFTAAWGNAGSTHALGRIARDAVERARALVAEAIGASPEEIVFTSGATESDNLAILGVVRGAQHRAHVVSSVIEHKAVLAACRQAEREQHALTLLRPDAQGRVDPADVRRALRDDTRIVSLMLGNNEIGTLNPVRDIAAVLDGHDVLFHCDAAQGIGQVPFDVRHIGVDLVSISAHKLYGPKGIGALFVRKGVERKLQPLGFGGGQEGGLRPGTLNVPSIVGFGEACRIARMRLVEESDRIRSLRDALLQGIRAAIPHVTVNGSLAERLPGNLNVSFGFMDAKRLMDRLDGRLCASLGSACTSERLHPSHVLRGIGAGNDRARSSVRFGVGRFTTREEIDRAIALVAGEVDRLRRASPLWQAIAAA